jgi:ATP-dependent 26S proteasome regulatory subunit
MEILETINSTFKYTMRMSIFNYIKTDNPIIDAILSTATLTLIGYLLNTLAEGKNIINIIDIEQVKGLIYKKNTIILEGKKSSTTNVYGNLMPSISAIYSDRFKAFWYHIITNIDNNKTIYEMKESLTNCDSLICEGSRKKILDFFMVSQTKHFKINNDIFVRCVSYNDDSQNEKITTRTEKITIEIYSYSLTLSVLKQYIDNITFQYLNTIKTNRFNKKFIYILNKVNYDEDSIYNCWNETEYQSTRNFNNMFFDGKQEFIDKINFFLSSKKWYEDKGIPYTLGIGLHGLPGTGKTSLIKALANYTKRHIIYLSLKIIKTKQQLDKFFFENTYNSNNEKDSVSFDQKIIVIEDIDCIGDIVLNRKKKYKDRKYNQDNSILKVDNVIKTITDINNLNSAKITSPLANNENAITLDDILNLWDGIRETSGRILIITSNHYNELDPALIRPGRIDISHRLSNASYNTIAEMYRHFFGSDIEPEQLKKIKEYFYSPAEIVNIYISCKTEEKFIKRLIVNKKVC